MRAIKSLTELTSQEQGIIKALWELKDSERVFQVEISKTASHNYFSFSVKQGGYVGNINRLVANIFGKHHSDNGVDLPYSGDNAAQVSLFYLYCKIAKLLNQSNRECDRFKAVTSYFLSDIVL